jgi:hypothetical protein
MNAPPPGHNEDVSMLSGGTEPIVAVMGGGKKGSTRVKSAKSAKKGKKRMKGGERVGTIEQVIHKVDLDRNADLEKIEDKDAFNLIATYVKNQKQLWIRQASTGNIADVSKIITKGSCGTASYDEVNGDNGQAGSDRLGCILPENIASIIVIPPIYGNFLTYTACINTLTGNNVLTNKDFVVLFAPPLFSGKDVPGNEGHKIVNRDILLHFLNMKATSQATIYSLAEYTQNSIYTACSLTTTQDYLVPLLEPSYVLYPYIRKFGDTTFRGILFSAAAANEVILPASTSTTKLGLIGALQNMDASKDMDETKGEFVAFPPNIKKEDSLLNKTSVPYKKYRFLANYSNAAYLLDTTSISINIFKTRPASSSPLRPTYKDGDKFKMSNEAFLIGVTYSIIPLGVKQYSLRHPRTLEVINDWKNLIFTEAESEFLNDINLRPDILNDLYAEKYNGRPWNIDLATNLSTIVRSKCFNDNRLVLHSSCQASQKFITDVLEFFVKHDSRIKALEQNELEAENNRLKSTLDYKLSAAKKAAESGMNKNPFNDNLIFRTGQSYANRFNIIYTPIEEVASRRYSRTVIVRNVTTKTYDIAKFICSAPECTNINSATEYLERQYQILKTQYPNYTVAP